MRLRGIADRVRQLASSRLRSFQKLANAAPAALPPATLLARTTDGTHIQLDATASPTVGVDHYRFERLILGVWTEISTVLAAAVATPVSVGSLVSGTGYLFRAIAIKGADESVGREAAEKTLAVSFDVDPLTGDEDVTDFVCTFSASGGTLPYTSAEIRDQDDNVLDGAALWDGAETTRTLNLTSDVTALHLKVIDSAIGEIESAPISVTVAGDATPWILEDTFTGTNNTALTAHAPDVVPIGSSWAATIGTFKLSSGTVIPNSALPNDVNLIDTGVINHTVFCDPTISFTDNSNNESIGIVFRATDADNHFVVVFVSDHVYLFEKVSGSYGLLADAAYSLTATGAPRHISISFSATDVKVWVNNVPLLLATMTHGLSATKVGIYYGKSGTPPGICSADDLRVPILDSGWSDVGGQGFFVAYPPTASIGVPIPLVVYCHGAGETEFSIFGRKPKEEVIATLTANGYFVMTSQANDNNWGNAASQATIKALYDALVGSGWDFSRVVFVGQSMGGLDGLSMLANSTDWPTAKGFYGLASVCSLSNMYGGGAGTYEAQIEAAYSFADPTGYAAATAGHDPLLLTASLFNGKRLRFCASSADTVVDKAANSDAMSAHVAANATEFGIITHTGDHGSDVLFEHAADVLAFCNRCV